MNEPALPGREPGPHRSLFQSLKRRGVLRVAASYLLIGWLLLQIGDVVLEPLGAPDWVMRALIVLVLTGFPIALVLAWYFELGPSGITLDHLPETAARPRVQGARRYSDLIVIVLLLGVIAVLLARQGGLLEPEAEPPVIAVLPFQEPGAGEQSYFGYGLSDTLIHKLGQVAGLVVLASTSTREFSGPGVDRQEVARKLGANAILEGSLQRAADVLRVNVRLLDAATGQQRWTASFNRRTGELFDVQDEIATAVTSALEVELAPAESRRLTHRDTLNLTAYEAYQRARDGIASRNDERLAESIQYLFDAIETDPNYALAHAALPEALFLASVYRGDTSWPSVAEAAHQAAEKAIALDPELGEAWLARAFVRIGNLSHEYFADIQPDAEVNALLEQAIAFSPNNAVAWKQYSQQATSEAEGLARLERAARLDPRSGIVLVNLGVAYQNMGQDDKARQMYILAVGTSQPFFELGMVSLLNSYPSAEDGLAMGARWGHEFTQAYPDHATLWREYGRTLIELGAGEELEAELRRFEPKIPAGASLPRLYSLGLQSRLQRQRGDLQAAARYAEQFAEVGRALFSQRGDRPFDGPGPPATVLDAIPLAALERGDAAAAVAHYERHFANIDGVLWLGSESGLNPRLLKAASQKQLGDRATAESALRTYLGEVAALPSGESEEVGFVPFALHAFLGETEAAIAALQQVVDSGYRYGWWGLREGAFDADYARVLADPRGQALLQGLEAGIAAQREAFRAEPNLPLEVRLQAGLPAVQSGSP